MNTTSALIRAARTAPSLYPAVSRTYARRTPVFARYAALRFPTRTPFRTRAFTTAAPNDEPSPKPPSPGIAGKLKDLMTKYGRHALAVYLALSAVDLGLTFLLVHLAGADKIEWVKDAVVAQWRSVRYGADAAQELKRLEEEEQRVKDAEEAQGGAGAGGKKKKANAMLWAEFALAYGIHKTLLLPVRVGATAAVTPKLVHWLTARGWVGKVGTAGWTFSHRELTPFVGRRRACCVPCIRKSQAGLGAGSGSGKGGFRSCKGDCQADKRVDGWDDMYRAYIGGII